MHGKQKGNLSFCSFLTGISINKKDLHIKRHRNNPNCPLNSYLLDLLYESQELQIV